jgi:hypothetical protein
LQAIQKRLENYKLPADELIPIFYFVVVRAGVLQLGSEINFIADFMETYLMGGQIGYSFTTIMVGIIHFPSYRSCQSIHLFNKCYFLFFFQGIYDHILKEKITMDD